MLWGPTMSPTSTEPPLSKLRQLIESGTNVVGSTAAAALSVVSGSAELGVALTAIGATGIYQKVGSEIADRWLAPREQARIGGVLALSVELLKSELDRGRTLREDGFFNIPHHDRSDAEEVLEGVLRKAQSEYEERKLRYLSHLWANACLDEALGVAKLNYMVKLAEQLTYRQLTLITLAGQLTNAGDNSHHGLREEAYGNAQLKMRDEVSTVLAELKMLHQLDCVRIFDLLSTVDITPAGMRLGSWGFALYNDMELYRIAKDDPQHFGEVIRLLK